MSTDGPRFPGTVTTASVSPESANDWLTPGNISADDGSEAQITAATFDSPDISFRLIAANLGFNIPAGAVIDGITVEIDRRSIIAGSGKDFRVQLQDAAAALVGDNKADTVNAWPTSSTIKSYGGAADTWNASPTAAMVNDPDFGVVLSASAAIANADIGVDFIRVTIDYSLFITPSAIAGGEVIPNLILLPGSVTVVPTAVASEEALGSAIVQATNLILAQAIDSGETIPGPILIPGAVLVQINGIPTGEIIGSVVLQVAPKLIDLTNQAILSSELFGIPILLPGGIGVNPTGISSGEIFGSVILQPGQVLILPAGIGSSELLGIPTFKPGQVLILPGGITSNELFGAVVVNLAGSGFIIEPLGIPSGEASGSQTVLPGLVNIVTTGISPQDAFGQPGVTPGGVLISPQGLEAADTFGLLQLLPGGVLILPVGITPEDLVGDPTLTVRILIASWQWVNRNPTWSTTKARWPGIQDSMARTREDRGE